mmetsp:Transcript_34056/g.78686  ORF Transcript_34056/g.78686 Transcript_34056/m.78686 type:complete len:163 (-) Transcript_34056:16-504(-)
MTTQDAIKAAFAKYDTSRSGVMERESLCRVVASIVAPLLSPSEVEMLLTHLLGDSTGPVAYAAFVDGVFDALGKSLPENRPEELNVTIHAYVEGSDWQLPVRLGPARWRLQELGSALPAVVMEAGLPCLHLVVGRTVVAKAATAEALLELLMSWDCIPSSGL